MSEYFEKLIFKKGSVKMDVLFKETMLIAMRDGRKLYGILRSYDQFGKTHIYISDI